MARNKLYYSTQILPNVVEIAGLSNYKARQPSHNILKLTIEMYSFTSTLLGNTAQNNIKQFIYSMIIQHVSLAIYHV